MSVGVASRVMMLNWVLRPVLAVVVIAFAQAASAVEASKKIQIELNDLQPADQGCRAVFVIHNGLAAAISKLTLRVVAFNAKGHARLFMSLDVGTLAIDKTRVLRFDLGPDSPCSDLSRFVLDDITVCDISGIVAGQCLAAAQLSTRAGLPFDF